MLLVKSAGLVNCASDNLTDDLACACSGVVFLPGAQIAHKSVGRHATGLKLFAQVARLLRRLPLGSFTLDYEYEIEYEYEFPISNQ